MASTSTALESNIWCVAASYRAARGRFQTASFVLGVEGDMPGKARAWCHVRRMSAESVGSVKRIVSGRGIRRRDSLM